MKKIYMILAAITLLSMSLNAQMISYKAVGKQHVSLEKSEPVPTAGLHRAPAKVTLGDGEYLLGPYTTDDYNSTGKGLYSIMNTYGRTDITSIIARSEFESFLGDEIIGYRFATTGTVSCYSFVVSAEGPNHWINDIYVFNLQSSGSYVDVSGTTWHEYTLDTPVTFEVPDSVIAIWVGYQYYQEYSSGTWTAFPILVNPNSTSHDTWAYNYNSGNFYDVTDDLGGDLAAQLIMRSSLEKTDPPVISSNTTATEVTITATATDPNATVTLNVGGEIYTGTGSVTTSIPRTNNNQSFAVKATAQEEGKAVSNEVTTVIDVPAIPKTATPTLLDMVDNGNGTYTITATGNGTVTLTVEGFEPATGTGSASVTITQTENVQNLIATATAIEPQHQQSDPATRSYTIPAIPKTDQPTLLDMVDNGDGTVTITATGNGTVKLTALGQTVEGQGSASITIVRAVENQTITVTATAQESGKLISNPATRSYNIPALTGDPTQAQDGLLRMHLLVVDQLKEEIPDDNSHPDRYGYVLRWEQPASVEDHKESGTVEVEIQKTEAKVNGYYTLDQIDADVNVGINHDLGLTMDVLTADASMFLPGENPDVLYYQMQGKKGENPGLGVDYLTQLQYMKNVKMYEEMLATSPNKTHKYPANETYHYYDDSTPIVTGTYNDVTSFMTYAPSVSTWGVQRRYFEVDHLDNTYGAPIWKTAVGQVKLNSAVHERQKNQWNSVNWKDEGGNDCSLYILDNIEAEGYLPHTGISNVEYEPYMFRIFVESKNGKLRPYTVVPQGDGDHDGEHLVAGTGTTTGPICVWSGYYMDGDVNGMTFSGPRASETVSGQMKYVFTKVKVDRSTDNVVNPWDDLSDPWNDFDTITDPETGAIIKIIDTNRGKANAMFGALDNLAEIIGTDEQGRPIYAPVSEDDLKVFVRFYYVAAGTADGHVPDSRAGGAAYPAGYGTESPGKAPSPWTIVNELRYHGEIVSQTYVNTMGMQSDRPFDGVNIVITRYSDGTTSTTKVLR